jgi:hypothetical protein
MTDECNAAESSRDGLLDGSICPDCAELVDVCQTKADVKGSCWRWNAAYGRFETSREELFERLILHVPTGFTPTRNEYGEGRKYHKAVGDLLDAFWAFCDEKEAGCDDAA